MQKLINKIVCGDCIELLGKVKEPFADLIFADPPFNIGYQYDHYQDKLKKDKYIAWTKDWMTVCRKVLKPHGSLYIAIGDDYAANVKLIADELGLVMRNWIIWHYTFGQQTKEKFARSHTHIFYFVKDKKNFTFNDYAVRVPSDRQLIYNDKRAHSKGKMPNDVWDQYSRVCGTFKEREGWHPCQMPENLLARIIAVSSRPGDVVLDPFNGSGTTTAVACQLGRKYVGIDISKNYAANARKRIAELKHRKISINSSDRLDAAELLELKRLYVDIGIDYRRILDSKKLLGVFTRQFAVRMNNGKPYSEEIVAASLMDLDN
ncbi:MAG TPA: site-specific DNA-methyltransferase [Planctomycetes bacterium]|nr:site-specific DNA-methyltransferase [Planctomycetota bacterium]HIJ70157.1 site-specific DNA-methyltransferase [Planctomycetota bacterium]